MNGIRMEARWKDIADVHTLDCSIQDYKIFPKLRVEHVHFAKIKKIKVKNAVQVLSQRVASIMTFLACKYFLVGPNNYILTFFSSEKSN